MKHTIMTDNIIRTNNDSYVPKQLPLRQQRDKPILKYSGNRTGAYQTICYQQQKEKSQNQPQSTLDNVTSTNKRTISSELIANYIKGGSQYVNDNNSCNNSNVSNSYPISKFVPRSSQQNNPMKYTFINTNGHASALTPAQILTRNLAKVYIISTNYNYIYDVFNQLMYVLQIISRINFHL